MSRYKVTCHVALTMDVVVEGEGFSTTEAAKMAASVVERRLVGMPGVRPDFEIRSGFPSPVEIDNTGAPSEVQVCEHCRLATPKELWGPGRMLCPKCFKRPLAASSFPHSEVR
jgi:hypothetical protein